MYENQDRLTRNPVDPLVTFQRKFIIEIEADFRTTCFKLSNVSQKMFALIDIEVVSVEHIIETISARRC